ncbi:T9SS type A sorting domain-containing protein [Mangrovimonas spongiae]|uniref:T9SS C-terminal target domain-containing protein n=1 Tax=Mangrovimonas spongiae TaxID=2494697 RepID=A0A3R9N3Q3_9FLAO|nr:T9SS type A sorting domain-containing protein [Mangrovimonas spongiae]RSK38281.1 T9SS C-terminal target domain-containing protein [Mangrovimonas spongiae]
MKKNTWYLCITLCYVCFSWQSSAQSQSTENFATNGSDDAPTVLSISNTDITVNQGQPIQSIFLGTFTSHYDSPTGGTGWCDDWYAFNLEVTGGTSDGVSITNGCDVDFNGLDVTGFTTITITSVNIDDYIDTVYFDIDLEVTYQTPSCLAPGGMQASNVTTSSADLSWTAGDTETVWYIEWKADTDFTPGNGEEDGADTISSTPEYNNMLQSLMSETVYYVYYQADCGGDVSAWVAYSFVTLSEPPTNDDCANAEVVTIGIDTCGPEITASNNEATNSGVAQASCATATYSGGDIWYSFTVPTGYSMVNYTRNASDFSTTQVELYSGTCGSLIEEGCTTSASHSFSGLTSGATYYLRIYDWGNNDFGDVLFCLGVSSPLANDDCANAEILVQEINIPNAESATPNSGTIEGATNSGLAAESCNSFSGTANDDVWYAFEALTGNVNITVDDETVFFDIVIQVYSGVCGALVNIGCADAGNPEEAMLTGLTPGETYYFRIYQYGDTSNTLGKDFNVKLWSSDALSNTDIEKEQLFTYYPNPVNDMLSIKAQSNISKVSVYNMLGQEIIRITPNTVTNEVNMSELQAGAYFVKVIVGEITKTLRVIKR